FWRGWFYSIDPCDIAIDTVKYAVVDLNALPQQNSAPVMRGLDKPLFSGSNAFDDISKIRNRADKGILFYT
ncbi:hypothetical protein, partial [Escherichia coli]|uniref:hypothetical protein n=1 Tax=Escherichia coli TaxID=562 RepID=UPI001953E5E4